MRLLYGSQNFGYDNEQSDKDYLEFVYPTWEDILYSRKLSKQINIDSGIVKIYDIRDISSILAKQNLSNMQFMFSEQYIDCGDLKWFIDNRDRLIKSNKWSLFKHNQSVILSNINLNSPKTLTRAWVYLKILNQVSNNQRIESLKIKEGKDYREFATKVFGTDSFEAEQVNLRVELARLETYYSQFENYKDTNILHQADEEIIRLMKLHLEEV